MKRHSRLTLIKESKEKNHLRYSQQPVSFPLTIHKGAFTQRLISIDDNFHCQESETRRTC